MTMTSFLDIPYSTDLTNPFLHFDIYLSVDCVSSSPLICFVHGGAWVSEDKSDHAALAIRLADTTRCAVAVPNYRLSPRQEGDGPAFRHPGHTEDLLQFLHFIHSWQGPAAIGRPYDPSRLYLIGHSCSAHMLSCIFLDSSRSSPSLTPSPSLLESVQALIMSEGIYDLDLLSDRFPKYCEWFFIPVFGDHPSFSQFSVTTFPPRKKSIRWLILHSTGDTMVDVGQSQAMLKHLNESHDGDRITGNLEQLHEEHDNVLASDIYVQIVSKFILDDSNRY